MATDTLSKFFADFKAGYDEAKAEQIRITTPIAHWSHLFDDFNFSPTEFYDLVAEELTRREVPDLVMGLILLHQGTVFSKKRLYLEMRRERFAFQICAAPFGTSWFVSSRLFDRRRDFRWGDLIVGGGILVLGSAGIVLQAGVYLGIAIMGLIVTLLWSLMRLAASESMAKLDQFLCNVPILGRVYERFFFPNTYFRQDQCTMYREVVQRSVMAAIGKLQTQKGLKPLTELESRPVLEALHRR